MPPSRPPRKPASAARSRTAAQPSGDSSVKHIYTLESIVKCCDVQRDDVLPVVCEGTDIIYCKLCKETFSGKDGVRAMERHVCKRIHTERMAAKLNLDHAILEAPPIPCGVCGDTVARADSLTRHMKQHSERSSGSRRAAPVQRSSSVPAFALPHAPAMTRSSSLPANAYELGRSSSMPQTHFQSNLQTPYTQPSVHYNLATTSYPSYSDSPRSHAPPIQFAPRQAAPFYTPTMYPYDTFTSVSNGARRTSTFPATHGPSDSSHSY